MTTQAEVIRRRRTFLGLIALLIVGTLAFTFLGPRGELPTSSGRREQPAPGFDQVQVAKPSSPPAYLAWMSGGFPADVRAQVRTIGSLTATVVVAGDTRWMTRSADADGRTVDRPKPPFRIPIDAFAVNPVEYGPFLPEDVRDVVVSALERGEGVLSTRSARLRGIGEGGTLTFGDQAMRIGAIAPDEAIGWAELLVSRDVGDHLGIVDDRYLLALSEGAPSEEGFAELIGTLLPEGTPLRVERPGGSRFMRVASGVNPPIVLKEEFGEFAAFPDPSDPAKLTIEPSWVRTNIRTRSVPVLGRVTCNVAFFPALLEALREVERSGLSSLLQTYNGCWNARTVARNPTAPPSFHAYGAAIDINAATNAFGSTPTMDERVVAIFERHGFTWGGIFLIPDGMHFEFGQRLGEPLEQAA